MTTELILRREAPPLPTMLVVHFGSGLQATDQIIKNSISNYSAYGPVLRDLGRSGDGSFTLSVYGVRGTTTVGDLLRGPGARWPMYGTSSLDGVTAAGFELWPTTVVVDGVAAAYSHDHFDIPIPGGNMEIVSRYRSLDLLGRRALRDHLRGPFEELLGLFEPRRRSYVVQRIT